MTKARRTAQEVESYTADYCRELARQETEKAHASNRDGTHRAALHFTNAAAWLARAEDLPGGARVGTA